MTAISGTPIAEVVERRCVRSSRTTTSRGGAGCCRSLVATAEVLRGLSIVKGPTATFSFADGTEATAGARDGGAGGPETLGGSARTAPDLANNPGLAPPARADGSG